MAAQVPRLHWGAEFGWEDQAVVLPRLGEVRALLCLPILVLFQRLPGDLW